MDFSSEIIIYNWGDYEQYKKMPSCLVVKKQWKQRDVHRTEMSVFFGEDINQIKNQKHTQKQSAAEQQRVAWIVSKPAFYLLRSERYVFRKPIL